MGTRAMGHSWMRPTLWLWTVIPASAFSATPKEKERERKTLISLFLVSQGWQPCIWFTKPWCFHDRSNECLLECGCKACGQQAVKHFNSKWCNNVDTQLQYSSWNRISSWWLVWWLINICDDIISYQQCTLLKRLSRWCSIDAASDMSPSAW